MSVLGVSWDSQGLILSCRPDPALPARALEDLVDLDPPERVTFPPGGRSDPIQVALDWALTPDSRTPPALSPDSLREGMASYFNALGQRLYEDPKLHVMLMEPVSEFVFVAPSTSTNGLETFREALSGIDAEVTVAAYPLAAAATAMGKFDPARPFVLIEWEDDLLVSLAVSYETRRHMSRTESRQKLQRCGPAVWRREMRRRLDLAAAGMDIAIEGSEGPGKFHVSASEWSRATDEIIDHCLRDGADATFSVRVVRRESGDESTMTLRLKADGLTGPVVEPVVRFLENALDGLGDVPSWVVLTGSTFEAPPVLDRIGRLLDCRGLLTCTDRRRILIEGAHLMATGRGPRALPYDVGLALRWPDWDRYVGGLVLVRPTRIGQMRESGKFVMPLDHEGVLQAAFYTRVIDFEAGRVSCHVMRSHDFVPAKGPDGRAHIRARMMVEAGVETEEMVTVSVSLQDLVSQQTIEFKALPITGGEPLPLPLARGPAEIEAIALRQRLDRAADRLGRGASDASVQQWRSALEGGGKVPRLQYGIDIHMATGSPMPAPPLDLNTILTAEPEAFQAAARQILFRAMHTMAREAAGSKPEGRLQAWRRRYPATNDAPQNPQCADHFVNAFSQDHADQTDAGHELRARRVRGLREYYGLACSPARSLNIDWDNKETAS